jgi:hypothetical protein
MDKHKFKLLLKESLQSVDVSNLPSSEVKKLKDKNKTRKDVVFTSSDEKIGDGKGLSEDTDIEEQDDLLEENIRKYVRAYLNKKLNEVTETPKMEAEPIGSLEAMPTDDDVMIQRFPQLKEALLDLMGRDFKAFIKDIKYIAPKPTTFKIEIGNEHFNLIWSGEKTKFVCEAQGKKYYLIYTKEKEQAIKAINRLLRQGSTTSQENTLDDGGNNMPNLEPDNLDKMPEMPSAPKTPQNSQNISPEELDKL